MRFLILAALPLLLLSCNGNSNKPDVSGINTDVTIRRFDRDFFALDTNNLESSFQQLSGKYPSFLPVYFEYFSPVNFIVRQQGKTYGEALRAYYSNIRSLYDSVQQRFPKLDKLEKDLGQNLRYVKYYYPSFRTPVVLTTVESLNPENKEEIYGTLYFHDTLVISLQMFLGKDFPVYDPAQYFDYLRRRFEPQYIVPNSFRAIAAALQPDTSQGLSLMEQMIEKGKQWYLMEHLLPDAPDSLVTFYTQRQLAWCKENEGNIWGYISKNADLYTVDPETIQNYLGEGPFTQGMPADSPGNIGQWTGWQIVRKYAEKNEELKLRDILLTPPKKIFQESRYHPK